MEQSKPRLKSDPLLTPAQTAEMLSIGAAKLVRWRHQTRKTGQQHGPAWVELGHRTVRYGLSDVQAWIAEHTNG